MNIVLDFRNIFQNQRKIKFAVAQNNSDPPVHVFFMATFKFFRLNLLKYSKIMFKKSTIVSKLQFSKLFLRFILNSKTNSYFSCYIYGKFSKNMLQNILISIQMLIIFSIYTSYLHILHHTHTHTHRGVAGGTHIHKAKFARNP